MNAPQTVSQAYLLGISEGRAMLQTHERLNGPLSLTDARQFLRNCEDCLGMGFSGETLDCLKGERDFWRLKVKRLAEARALQGVAA